MDVEGLVNLMYIYLAKPKSRDSDCNKSIIKKQDACSDHPDHRWFVCEE